VPSLFDDAVKSVRDTYDSVKNKVASLPADLAARGKVITNVKPAHPADQDIASMAEDSARRQGRGSKSPLSSTMNTAHRKNK